MLWTQLLLQISLHISVGSFLWIFSYLFIFSSLLAFLSPSFLFFKHIYSSIIALQHCVSFCCIRKWISYMYTYNPITPPSCISLPPSLSHHFRWSQRVFIMDDVGLWEIFFLVSWCIYFLFSFFLLILCVISIGLGMLNQSCIPGINPTYMYTHIHPLPHSK